MSNYSKTVNFAVKDSLTTGDPNKKILGTELDTEFSNIATSVATKIESTGSVNITSKTGTTKTLSTSAASGGSDGDIWYRY